MTKKRVTKLYLRPLAEYRNPDYIPPKGNYDPALDFIPYDKFDELSFEEFFAIFNRMIGDNLGKNPNLDLLENVKQYGIGDGLECKLSAFSEAVAEELKGFCQRAKNDMSDLYRGTTDQKFVKNWQFIKPCDAKIANFKWDDLERARIAWAGFGALPANVAIYPGAFQDDAGEVLNGKNKYILHFYSEPPVDEFWSLTVYGEDKFLVPNELDRNGINDRSHFQKNEDGSFDLYIQKERPDESKISNWLPVGADTFELILRMYYAKEAVLEGKWKTPSIQRV